MWRINSLFLDELVLHFDLNWRRYRSLLFDYGLLLVMVAVILTWAMLVMVATSSPFLAMVVMMMMAASPGSVGMCLLFLDLLTHSFDLGFLLANGLRF